LGEFLHFGWLFTLGSISKITGEAQNLDIFFSTVLVKKWVELHFGPLFYKLLRSPWCQSKSTQLEIEKIAMYVLKNATQTFSLIVLHFCLEKKGLGFKDGGAPL
jgi:hypothetical protein